MRASPFPHLACPHDFLPLEKTEGTYTCTAGHSFDIAKTGYINLLPNQWKSSNNPGDNREMVQARRDFLNTGAYQRLQHAIASHLAAHASHNQLSELSLIDAGCGEGYYTAGVLTQVTESPLHTVSCLGFDISKHAVQAASKRSPHITWAVANNKRIPVTSNSSDAVMCLFGFPVFSEFQRVLKPNGLLILVDTGENHLRELRQRLYPEIKEKQIKLNTEFEEHFSVKKQQHLTYTLPPQSKEDLKNLLYMTPHAYRASPEKLTEVLTHFEGDITVDVILKLCHPKHTTK